MAEVKKPGTITNKDVGIAVGIGAGIGVGAYFLAKYLGAGPSPEPEECEVEGATRCLGVDLQKCVDGAWMTIEENSPECGGGNGEPEPGKWTLIAEDEVEVPLGMPSGKWTPIAEDEVEVPLGIPSGKWTPVAEDEVTVPLLLNVVDVVVELKNYTYWREDAYDWQCTLRNLVTGEEFGDNRWRRVTEKITFGSMVEGEKSLLRVRMRTRYVPLFPCWESPRYISTVFYPYDFEGNCWYRYNVMTFNVAIYCI